jgi:hypothetical protein
MNEFPMQIPHFVRVIQHRLGHEGAGLQIAPAFQLNKYPSAQITGPSETVPASPMVDRMWSWHCPQMKNPPPEQHSKTDIVRSIRH